MAGPSAAAPCDSGQENKTAARDRVLAAALAYLNAQVHSFWALTAATSRCCAESECVPAEKACEDAGSSALASVSGAASGTGDAQRVASTVASGLATDPWRPLLCSWREWRPRLRVALPALQSGGTAAQGHRKAKFASVLKMFAYSFLALGEDLLAMEPLALILALSPNETDARFTLAHLCAYNDMWSLLEQLCLAECVQSRNWSDVTRKLFLAWARFHLSTSQSDRDAHLADLCSCIGERLDVDDRVFDNFRLHALCYDILYDLHSQPATSAAQVRAVPSSSECPSLGSATVAGCTPLLAADLSARKRLRVLTSWCSMFAARSDDECGAGSSKQVPPSDLAACFVSAAGGVNDPVATLPKVAATMADSSMCVCDVHCALRAHWRMANGYAQAGFVLREATIMARELLLAAQALGFCTWLVRAALLSARITAPGMSGVPGTEQFYAALKGVLAPQPEFEDSVFVNGDIKDKCPEPKIQCDQRRGNSRCTRASRRATSSIDLFDDSDTSVFPPSPDTAAQLASCLASIQIDVAVNDGIAIVASDICEAVHTWRADAQSTLDFVCQTLSYANTDRIHLSSELYESILNVCTMFAAAGDWAAVLACSQLMDETPAPPSECLSWWLSLKTLRNLAQLAVAGCDSMANVNLAVTEADSDESLSARLCDMSLKPTRSSRRKRAPSRAADGQFTEPQLTAVAAAVDAVARDFGQYKHTMLVRPVCELAAAALCLGQMLRAVKKESRREADVWTDAWLVVECATLSERHRGVLMPFERQRYFKQVPAADEVLRAAAAVHMKSVHELKAAVALLPDDWCFAQVLLCRCPLAGGDYLWLCRLQSKRAPLVLPLCKLDAHSNLLDTLCAALRDNESFIRSFSPAAAPTGGAASSGSASSVDSQQLQCRSAAGADRRRVFWETRYQQDSRLKSVCQSAMSALGRGGWALLSGTYPVREIAGRAALVSGMRPLVKCCDGDRMLAEILVTVALARPTDGASRGVLEREDDAVALSKRIAPHLDMAKLRSAVQGLAKCQHELQDVKLSPVFFCLSKIMIEDASGQSAMSRVPSLHMVAHTLRAAKAAPPVGTVPTAVQTVDKANTFYLLDPDENLDVTRKAFQDLFASSSLGWRGVVGERPSKDCLLSAMRSSHLLIYCGHGSMSRLVSTWAVRHSRCAAAAFLMGCSSVAQHPVGAHGVSQTNGGCNVAHEYLVGGAPAVIGCAWTVTDRELDRVTLSLLGAWLNLLRHADAQSAARFIPVERYETLCFVPDLLEAACAARRMCKLRYLTGAACVVYGLPVLSNCQ